MSNGAWGWIAVGVLAIAGGRPVAAAASPTPAGTAIANTATLSAVAGGETATATSNTVTLIVAERLDVAVTAQPVSAGETAVAYAVTNTGSGSEAFHLRAALAGSTARVTGIAADRDGDGHYDPAVDTALNGDATDLLAPGATGRVFVLLDQPASGTVTLTATAQTGSGAPGTSFAGKGDGGGDAVVGQTGASASAAVTLGDAAAPTLAKSATVRSSDGSDAAVSGAVITYRLVAAFPAQTADATVTDPIPAGTRYVPGSLQLDGAPLSDAADDDAGRVDADGVAVSLGAVPATADHVVTFQVTVE